ncbi:MAG TPA: hypothetical protein VLI55_12185 [Bryobacteraceae bacterium]|nr:hypothetical protein [Bryobacteraceae bacterium]
MSHSQCRTHKLTYLLLGIAVPLGGYLWWCKTGGIRACRRKKERERLQEIAVEDSFPASDPPANW